MPESSENSPSSALARFGVIAGPQVGEELPVHAPVISIGQGAQNDLVLPDDSVSRWHARLEFEAGSWLLTDLDSTNGTLIEGVRLTPGVPTPLAYEATVRLGGVQLQFHAVEEADPEAARASFSAPAPAGETATRHFRLPLWVFVVILLLVIAAIFFLVSAGGAAVVIP